MNITAAKQQIKDTVEAYLTVDDAGMYVISTAHQRPIFMLGAPGIGKTAIMEQIARELEIGIVSYSMTHHTRQSALGLPRIETCEFEGWEYEASEYTMSEIVAAIYDYMKRTGLRRGILFLDEINCVSETLYPSMLQFLQFKTFGKHKVPEGWVVVCAGNPPEYNRSVHEFDIVTLDRMRQIDVEPDYGAWKAYATEHGLHPAVTSFIETKRDCFYKVESKPGGGKAFVTARGWEDLARVISLYEQLGKPVNRDLAVQFLRDDEIADKFAVYYELFKKYRSDYQVDTILAGETSSAIKDRARDAAFDERIALMSLILDSLAHECADVLDAEGVMLELRDTLRAAKPELLAGASAADSVGKRVADRERALGRKLESGVAAASYVRRERLILGKLKSLVNACELEGKLAGAEAFAVIEKAYKEEVAGLQPAAREASNKMNAAFDFVTECFGSREMLVFIAEVATRQTTTQFVARYGNDRYYSHSKNLKVDAARMGLAERAAMLEDLDANVKLADSLGVDMGGEAGLSLGGNPLGEGSVPGTGNPPKDSVAQTVLSSRESATGAFGSCGTRFVSPSGDSPEAGDAEHLAPAGGSLGAGAPVDLKAFYAERKFEYGFASVCKMTLPVDRMKGMKVLDLACRRGKGAYKLSAIVGDEGSVLGVDWNADYVAEAKDGMERAWRKSNLKRNNMEFRVAYPEDLMMASIGSSFMDMAYVNNVATLFADPARALGELARVLKKDGLLVLETVYADVPRDESVVAAARELGNSIQAARTLSENYAMLEAAGFGKPEIVDEYDVEVDRGFQADSKVETAPSSEDVRFKAVTIFARKR
ncbi:MAG: methyltransferase domain-containing protein [Eggerthellaceae bacterium]|nr:methyltransferase domain-containing protein [Eggerthellaceae bacterium]